MLQSLFGMEGPVWKFFNRTADLILLGILWFVTSIPLVTLGASTTAAYYVVLSMVRKEEGYLFRGYVKSFRLNFKQATVAWLLLLVAFTFLGIDIFYYASRAGQAAKIILGISACLGIGLLLLTLYLFPVISRFSNTTTRQFSTAFLLAGRHITRTIPLGVLAAGYVALCWRAPVLLFIGFGVYAYAAAFLLNSVFVRYEKST